MSRGTGSRLLDWRFNGDLDNCLRDIAPVLIEGIMSRYVWKLKVDCRSLLAREVPDQPE
jgi:hypothetical protein